MTRVQFQEREEVGWLSMDDGKANAINQEFLDDFNQALDQAEERGVRALVLQGREGFFSGGLDLKLLPTLPTEELENTVECFGRTMQRLAGFERPVVAAVAGHAIAGGSVMILCCDQAFGVDDPRLKLGLNEAALGITLPPAFLELGRQKLIPQALLGALAHGRLYSFDEGRKIGFLDMLCSPEELLDQAQEAALQLARLPASYTETKRSLRAVFLDPGVPSELTRVLEGFFRNRT